MSASPKKEASQPVHSIVVACEFVRLAKDGLTQLQLQKLVYYANGWHLEIFGSPLTMDNVEAWDHGPIYRELWNRIKTHGKNPIMKIEPIQGEFVSKDQDALIKEVFETYGHMSGFRLTAMTHQEDSPWFNVYVSKRKFGGVIPHNMIKRYFQNLRARLSVQ